MFGAVDVGVALVDGLFRIAQSTTLGFRPADANKSAVEVLEIYLVRNMLQKGVQQLLLCPKVSPPPQCQDYQPGCDEGNQSNLASSQRENRYCVVRIAKDWTNGCRS